MENQNRCERKALRHLYYQPTVLGQSKNHGQLLDVISPLRSQVVRDDHLFGKTFVLGFALAFATKLILGRDSTSNETLVAYVILLQ